MAVAPVSLPYDPCRTSGSCFIAGWVADRPDTSEIPNVRPFTLLEKVTQCCPGLACECAVPGGLKAPVGGNYVWPDTDKDNPMITHINGRKSYELGVDGAAGLAKYANNVTIKIQNNDNNVLDIPGEKVEKSSVPE